MSSLDLYIQNLHDHQCIFQIPKNEVKEIEHFVIHIVKRFIPTTIKALNPNFTVLEVVNAGRYFEHTKVKNPDEFDLMVVMRELSKLHRPVAQRGSILLVELVAIVIVLEFCILERLYNTITTLKIFSDSQSAVGLLTLN
ncbi:Hypothetical predicted protein [Mytilus galloprovincialis]|uniref:Uncharacterized protein n=1 Tax=Mytilus galloprovincialis TaxID=29158 RepID=A0A8B6HB13_MYTGA|nr:Hypothetical predicted protein [Mytilus galloprovincialis]